jgi:mono/diheme cytochrome c family protein
VNIKQTKLSTIRAFSIGFSASLLVMACGSDDGDDTPAPEPGISDETQTPPDNGADPGAMDPTPIPVDRADCDDNPELAECETGGGQNDPVEQEPVDSEYDLQKAAAENILRANCGQCHGAALNDDQVRAGMNYIDDLERLIDEGKVIGGSSDTSPIIVRMRNGSMPPPSSGLPAPSEQDIRQVASFIDNPQFFPPVNVENCDDQLITFDDLYTRMQADILSLDADDRLFTRYVLLTNRYNSGVCSQDLDRDRWGLSKMLNMLSIETSVQEPFAIDSDETIYRIDIRDYGWDRDIEVNNVNFVDGWEAIVGNNDYAVVFEGDEAETVIDQSGTEIPWLYSDALIDQASLGNLYYALIDVDVNDTFDDFILDDLQIDVIANLDEEDLVRAGTTRSVISRQDRVVERHEIEVRQGAFWQSFDFDADEANESIFDDPFGFAEGGREGIFTLPNGFMGFIIADADDNIVEESDILFDTLQNDFVARTSVSCSGCHAQGFLPVEDEVRAVVEANPFNFNADDFEAVQDVYPDPDEFAEIVDDDSDLYQRSLGRAGVPVNEADPMSGVFLQFDRDMDLRAVAGDVGLDSETFRQNLNIFDPQIQIVRQATIDRDDFTALFLASICVAQTFSQNQPNIDDCQDAIDELEQ